MSNYRSKIFGLLFCLVVFTCSVFADGMPATDPIVDLESGSGSNSYFGGVVTLTFTATQGNNCFSTDFSAGNTPILSCGTTSSFIRPGDPTQAGVFQNDTGVNITNIHVHIETFFADGTSANVSQGGFTEFAAVGSILFPGQQVVDADGNGTTFTGGNVAGCSPSIDISCTPGEFKIGYAEVLIPTGGTAVIEFDANHPLPTPEPSSLALLAGVIPSAWMMRKRLARY